MAAAGVTTLWRNVLTWLRMRRRRITRQRERPFALLELGNKRWDLSFEARKAMERGDRKLCERGTQQAARIWRLLLEQPPFRPLPLMDNAVRFAAQHQFRGQS
jgi:hypothetical protein